MDMSIVNDIKLRIVDEAWQHYDQGYRFDRTYRADELNVTVQVRVRRDSYARSSYAMVELLADNGTWTRLADELPHGDDSWYSTMPYEHATFDRSPEPHRTILDVTERLITRAARVLGVMIEAQVSSITRNQDQ